MAKSAVMVAAGKASSFSRPARRAKAQPAERIPVCVPSPAPFVEGPGPGKAWWEKALSEKSFSGSKRGNKQQNQGVGAKLRTTNLGPFGEVIRQTGPMAEVNPFRFSTKYQDNESDLLYYGYRFYDPSTGRWPNRDPLGEWGGLNIYCFVNNDPPQTFDYLGFITVDIVGIPLEMGPEGGSASKQWSQTLTIPLPTINQLFYFNWNISATVSASPIDVPQSQCFTPPEGETRTSTHHFGFDGGITADFSQRQYNSYEESDSTEHYSLSFLWFRMSVQSHANGSRKVWIGHYCNCYKETFKSQGSGTGEANVMAAALIPILADREAAEEFIQFLRNIARSREPIPGYQY